MLFLFGTLVFTGWAAKAAVRAAKAAEDSAGTADKTLNSIEETSKLELRARISVLAGGVNQLIGEDHGMGHVALRNVGKLPVEYTDRLPGMVEAFSKLPTQSAMLDGELCLIDAGGSAHFYRLMREMRTHGRTGGGAVVQSAFLALVANAAPVEAPKRTRRRLRSSGGTSYLKRPTRPTPTPRPLRTPMPPR